MIAGAALNALNGDAEAGDKIIELMNAVDDYIRSPSARSTSPS